MNGHDEDVVAAVKNLKRTQEHKSQRLEDKVDDLRDIIQSFALKTERELAELKVQHDFMPEVLSKMSQIGENKATIAVLLSKVAGVRWIAATALLFLFGQWAAIIRLWQAMP